MGKEKLGTELGKRMSLEKRRIRTPFQISYVRYEKRVETKYVKKPTKRR
jgi:hypothetical protein